MEQESWKGSGIHYKQWKHIVLVAKKNSANKNSSVRRNKQNRLKIVSNGAVCSKKRVKVYSKPRCW